MSEVSEQTNEWSGASKRSEQCGASKRVSGKSGWPGAQVATHGCSKTTVTGTPFVFPVSSSAKGFYVDAYDLIPAHELMSGAERAS